MYLQFGNYKHPSGEVHLSPISRQSLVNEGGQMYGWRERWRIRGFLQAATVPALTTAIQGLQNAYSNLGQTLQLFNDDNSLTAQVLNNMFGGIRVVTQPSFPVGEGAEYSTFRQYEIEVEGDTRYSGVPLIAWSETVSYTGGGPVFVFLEPINGPPQKQLVKFQSAFRAVQRGSAIGQFGFPQPPPPIWPADLERNPEPAEVSPRRHGSQFSEFQQDWTYYFASVTPLQGYPNIWPG